MKNWLLTIILVLGYIPAFSQQTFYSVADKDSVRFETNKDGKTVTLTEWAHCNKTRTHLVIPGYVKHDGKTYRVTEIGDEAMGVEFYGDKENTSIWNDKHGVKKVTLPNTVKKIGDYAFVSRWGDCYKLELTDNVEYIGACAVNFMSLKDSTDAIMLPKNLRRLEYVMDDEDHEVSDFKFSKLYIPEHLEYIGGLQGFNRNQPLFDSVVVHPDNKHYKAINGSLYSYRLDTLYWSTIHEDLYIPKNLKVDINTIIDLEDGWYPHLQFPQLKSIVTEEGNPYCIAINNVLYDRKNKCLIMIPNAYKNSQIHLPAWCKYIRIMDGLPYPHNFRFSSQAKPEDVKEFVKSVIDITTEKDPLVFVYKGKKYTRKATCTGYADIDLAVVLGTLGLLEK